MHVVSIFKVIYFGTLCNFLAYSFDWLKKFQYSQIWIFDNIGILDQNFWIKTSFLVSEITFETQKWYKITFF